MFISSVSFCPEEREEGNVGVKPSMEIERRLLSCINF